MTLPPLAFEPLLKHRAWGGRLLSSYGKELPDEGSIGESWEIADLPDSIPDGCSRVAEGPFEGRSLRDLLETHRSELLGRAVPGPDGGFPLLIKLLDARENLSVQLHPSAEYARAHPEAALKTEAWIVLAAEPGARVYVGLNDTVDAARFREAIETGAFLDILQTADVSPGDAIFLESGLCHALGEGILVAEVQTPSDTTFRTWDWNRNDPARPLHIEPACASVRLGANQRTAWPRITRSSEATTLTTDALRTRRLIRCDFFEIDQLDLPETSDPNATMDFEQPSGGIPLVVMCTGGSGTIESAGETLELFTGRSVLIPASCALSKISLHVRDNEKPSLLRVRPTDVLDNSLA